MTRAAATDAVAGAPPGRDAGALGLEARVVGDDHMAVKLWLRLLACSTQIETELRKRLRKRFGITLARFDYLAQLHRQPDGLRMNALSRCLMVTGGSVTGLTDELEKERLVVRIGLADDRRVSLVKLTPLGCATFERIAAVHEAWLVELFGGVSAADRKSLHDLLGRMRCSVGACRSDPTASTEDRAA